VVIGALFSAGPAAALQLSPLDFSSLGSLNATGDLVLNTDTLQLSGGASFTGVLDSTSHAAVFTFDSIQTTNVSVIGSNPLALLSKGDAVFNGNVTSLNSGGFEIAAAGTVSLTNGASLSSGSTLSIFSQDLLLVGGANVVSGGTLTLATTQGLVPQGTVTAGNISITSQSGTNLFHSFNAFNVQPGEIQLFSGGLNLGGAMLTGATLASGSSLPVIFGVAPVPVPSALVLFATGLVACGGVLRRRLNGTKAR
jgi:hypothetical protein